MTRLGRHNLARALRRLAPDVVVSAHATPSAVMSSLREIGESVPVHTAVVTDFVAHRQWTARHVDRYGVAAEEVKHEYVAGGIPPQRIAVPACPCRAPWRVPSMRWRRAASSAWPGTGPSSWPWRDPADRSADLPELTRAMIRLPRSVQGLVECGLDAALQARLRRLTDGHRRAHAGLRAPHPHADGASDVLITKAGGMTVAEATAAEVPLILVGSLPGQERQNERFAARAGIARAARSPAAPKRLLERALRGPARGERMRRQVHHLHRPDASCRIVDLVLERTSAR